MRPNAADDGVGGSTRAGNLAQVVGFVTEFNQNVQIFGQITNMLMLMMAQVDAYQMQGLDSRLYAMMMLDPEGYADAAATLQTPDSRDPYEHYEEFQDNKKKASAKAKAASPIYAIQGRLDELEALLGVPKANDNSNTTTGDTAQPMTGEVGLVEQLSAMQNDLNLVVKPAVEKAQGAANDAKELAREAYHKALDAAIKASTIKSDCMRDATNRPPRHNPDIQRTEE
jgi:hypothetical protein